MIQHQQPPKRLPEADRKRRHLEIILMALNAAARAEAQQTDAERREGHAGQDDLNADA